MGAAHIAINRAFGIGVPQAKGVKEKDSQVTRLEALGDLRRGGDTDCRPAVAELLDMIGPWLMDAAVVEFKEPVQQDPSPVPHASAVQAGRAAAVAALCTVVQSRGSDEPLESDVVNKLLAVLLTVFSQRNRLVSATLICHGDELLSSGMDGIELLVPAVVETCGLLLAQSFAGTNSHPSIEEHHVRRACVKATCAAMPFVMALAQCQLPEPRGNDGKDSSSTFISLLPVIQRVLLTCIKHETDSQNIQLVVGLAAMFTLEMYNYEMAQTSDGQGEDWCDKTLPQLAAALCDHLCRDWISDLSVCMAALDALAAMGDAAQCAMANDTRTEHWSLSTISSLCALVSSQLSRPPPAHSRDLHSVVVAAYCCLQRWLVAVATARLHVHRRLMEGVAEVVEMGVMGDKRVPLNVSGDSGVVLSPITQRKPASYRVRDVAYQLMHCAFNPHLYCGDSGAMNLEDELFIENLYPNEEKTPLRYYAVDNTSVVALREVTGKPQNNNQGVPSCIVLLRTPFVGCRAVLCELLPRPDGQRRPPDWVEPPQSGVGQQLQQRAAAAQQEDRDSGVASHCVSDDDTFGDDCSASKSLAQDETVQSILSQLRSASSNGFVAGGDDGSPAQMHAVKPPPPNPFCEIGRLFLHDLGLLGVPSDAQSLLQLDSAAAGFERSLRECVDRAPCRAGRTVHLFFVPPGQTSSREILERALDPVQSTSDDFCSFVDTLGTVTEVQTAFGLWTGHASTAYKLRTQMGVPTTCNKPPTPHAPAAPAADCVRLDGRRHVVHWVSAAGDAETAALMPNGGLRGTQSHAAYAYVNGVVNVEGGKEGEGSKAADHPDPGAHKLNWDRRRRSRSHGDEQLVHVQLPLPADTRPSVTLLTDGRDKPAAAAAAGGVQKIWKRLTTTTNNKRVGGGTAVNVVRRRRTTILDAVSSAAVRRARARSPGAPGTGPHDHIGANRGQLPVPPVRPRRSKDPSLSLDARRDVQSLPHFAAAQMQSGSVPAAAATPQQPTKSPTGRMGRNAVDYRLMVFWLQRYDDINKVPIGDLLSYTDTGEQVEYSDANSCTDVFALFIHPLPQQPVCKIRFRGPPTKLGAAGPLLDGCSCTLAALPALVRHTSDALAGRRLAEMDAAVASPPPHVRRAAKVREFVDAYAVRQSGAQCVAAALHS